MSDPVYFCGCLDSVGHFVYAPGNRTAARSHKAMGAPEGCPWKYLDSSEFRKGVPQKQGNAVLIHKGGWTVLSAHDFTVDKRGGSHATFAIAADRDWDAMLAAVREQWPEILARIGPLIFSALTRLSEDTNK